MEFKEEMAGFEKSQFRGGLLDDSWESNWKDFLDLFHRVEIDSLSELWVNLLRIFDVSVRNNDTTS